MSSYDLSDASWGCRTTGTAVVTTPMGAAAKSADGLVKALTFKASGRLSSVSTDRQDLLVPIDETAWHNSWVINLQRHTGSISDVLQESRVWSLFCRIMHFQAVNAAIGWMISPEKKLGTCDSMASRALALSLSLPAHSTQNFSGAPGDFRGEA